MEAIIFALFGALVGGFLTFYAAERTVFSRSVIDERARWRDQIRSLSVSAVKAISDGNRCEIDRIHAELCLRLNPKDDEDRLILDILKKNCNKYASADGMKLVDRVAYLLKHDWERAKIEASFLKRLWWKPDRPRFDDYHPTSVYLSKPEFKRGTWLNRSAIWIFVLTVMFFPLYCTWIFKPIVHSYKSGLESLRCDQFDRCRIGTTLPR